MRWLYFQLFDLYTNARTKNNFRKRTCGTFIYLTVVTIVSSIALSSDSINIISQFRWQCCSTTSPSTNKSETSSYRQGCFSWNISVLCICILCIYINFISCGNWLIFQDKEWFFSCLKILSWKFWRKYGCGIGSQNFWLGSVCT